MNNSARLLTVTAICVSIILVSVIISVVYLRELELNATVSLMHEGANALEAMCAVRTM